ncbi:hypothetical protein ZIOFF_023426 [Zingiber officinale]|uniref:S-acyltransferase n=1 Tax=Zingiber officinale TaxID=94328 RepID=A0A8J5GWR0_ZINOF|nr:hypothetical protein ZIOFF_023426 [Zingiber officinale]
MTTLAQELKPKRLYQVWKGNNVSILLVLRIGFGGVADDVDQGPGHRAEELTAAGGRGVVVQWGGGDAVDGVDGEDAADEAAKDEGRDGGRVRGEGEVLRDVHGLPAAPRVALRHLQQLRAEVRSPLSLARPVHWLGTSTFLCVFVFVFSWLNIFMEKSHYHGSIIKTMKAQLLSLVLMLYTFVLFWFVGGLTAFHLYLIATNQTEIAHKLPLIYTKKGFLDTNKACNFADDMQTTYENFRYRYDKKENPYNRGYLRNLRDVFSSKIPPSMHDFRSWVLEETPPSTPNIRVVDVISRAEMGSEEPVTDAIPPLLRNLDYNRIEEGEDVKARHEADSSDVLDYPVAHSPRSSIDSLQSYRGDNGGSAEETAGEEVDESENYSKEYSIAAHTNEGDTLNKLMQILLKRENLQLILVCIVSVAGLAEEFQSKVAFAERDKI